MNLPTGRASRGGGTGRRRGTGAGSMSGVVYQVLREAERMIDRAQEGLSVPACRAQVRDHLRRRARTLGGGGTVRRRQDEVHVDLVLHGPSQFTDSAPPFRSLKSQAQEGANGW